VSRHRKNYDILIKIAIKNWCYNLHFDFCVKGAVKDESVQLN